ncbi:MAG TPA: hypothetical protein VNO34_05930 [Actinomycetota bacterium]|nr:hypothetical protein [Actinomycetota bacterium]
MLAELARRDLLPGIWLPTPGSGPSGSWPGSACTWCATECRYKNRIHATLIAFGHPCPVSDLFGTAGPELLHRLEIPEPWAGTLRASLELIEELDERIAGYEAELRRLGADHPYVPLLLTVPGITLRNAPRVRLWSHDDPPLRMGHRSELPPNLVLPGRRRR